MPNYYHRHLNILIKNFVLDIHDLSIKINIEIKGEKVLSESGEWKLPLIKLGGFLLYHKKTLQKEEFIIDELFETEYKNFSNTIQYGTSVNSNQYTGLTELEIIKQPSIGEYFLNYIFQI